MKQPIVEPTKAFAIFCRNLLKGGDPLSNDHYWDAYQDLMLAMNDRGVQAYLVTNNDTYLGNGRFTEGYTISTKTNLENITKVNNITVGLVLDRADFSGTDMSKINASYVHNIATNKIEMYKNFAQFQPYSIICKDKFEVIEAFKKIEGVKIVVKEPEGYGGFNVSIGDKSKIAKELPNNYPLLIQEFLDTSLGIPGLVTGVHDIRITVCGGNIIGGYIRKAKPGSLHSNIALGGTFFMIDIKDIPIKLTRKVHEIDDTFKSYPRFYSADFVYTQKGWKLLELNALLALVPVTVGTHAKVMLDKLADYFASIC